MKMKEKPGLTDRQFALLKTTLRDNSYIFPRGADIRACKKLESLGLAESSLIPCWRDYRRGITHCARAYRRTPAGKKAARKASQRSTAR